jgi:hypothetical protein
VLVHGRHSAVYTITDSVKQGTNAVIEILQREFTKFERSSGRLPSRLYLQLDNTSKQNKSQYMLGFLGALVPIPYHTIPYHTIPYHITPYHTIPYHTIPYHTIPYRTIGPPWGVSRDHLVLSSCGSYPRGHRPDVLSIRHGLSLQ